MAADVSAPAPAVEAAQPDAFELKREAAKEALTACQQARGLTSCWPCEKLFDCQTRNAYVDAVYLSMNKGQAGGFEF